MDHKEHRLRVIINFGANNYVDEVKNAKLKQMIKEKQKEREIRQMQNRERMLQSDLLKEEEYDPEQNAEFFNETMTDVKNLRGLRTRLGEIVDDDEYSKRMVMNLEYLRKVKKKESKERGNFVHKNRVTMKNVPLRYFKKNAHS